MVLKRFLTIIALFCISTAAIAQGDVSNVRVQQHDALIYVTYNLAVKADIELHVSFDNGTTYKGPMKHVSGAAGKGVLPEKDKIIVWNIVDEVGYGNYENVVIKILASPIVGEKQPQPPPVAATEGALISSGRKVYMKGGNQLSKHKVRGLMENNKYAATLYDRGIKNNNTGSWFTGIGIPGTCFLGFGAPILSTGLLVKSNAKIDISEAVNMYNAYPDYTPDGLLISKGRKIYPFNASNTVVNAKNMNVYVYYNPLSEYSVRELMADNNNALWLYNRGESLNKWGNIFIIVGPALAVSGAFTTFGIDGSRRDHWIMGSFTIIPGCLLFFSAPILKFSGIKNVKKSVNMYNKNTVKPVSGVDWKLDFTGNGLRLGMRF